MRSPCVCSFRTTSAVLESWIRLHPQQRGQASVEPLVEIALAATHHVVPVVPDEHWVAGVRDVVVNDANVDL